MAKNYKIIWSIVTERNEASEVRYVVVKEVQGHTAFRKRDAIFDNRDDAVYHIKSRIWVPQREEVIASG